MILETYGFIFSFNPMLVSLRLQIEEYFMRCNAFKTLTQSTRNQKMEESYILL